MRHTSPWDPLITMKGPIRNEFNVGNITENLQSIAGQASLKSSVLFWCLFFSQHVSHCLEVRATFLETDTWQTEEVRAAPLRARPWAGCDGRLEVLPCELR